MKAGWDSKLLSEVCENITVGHVGSMAAKYKESGIPFLRSQNIRPFEVSLDNLVFIDDAFHRELLKSQLRPGDLAIVRTGYPGTAAVIPETIPICNCSDLVIVRPGPKVDPHFLALFFNSNHGKEIVAGRLVGAAQKHFNITTAKRVAIPLPNIREQQRIVAILDEAFDGIASAKANAEKNLQNARELFDSHLRTVYAKRGDGWFEAPLSEFALSVSTGPFGSLLHKSDYVSDGVPLVNPINIVDGGLVPDPDKLIDASTKKRLGSYVLQYGDIVIARRGEIGRCAVIGASQSGWVCGTGCFFIRPCPTIIPSFLAHLIRSGDYRERLERASTGATMKNLSNTTLSNLPVWIPNLEQQERTLSLLERLSEESGRLGLTYQQKLTALDELKQSLLHRAFNGDL